MYLIVGTKISFLAHCIMFVQTFLRKFVALIFRATALMCRVAEMGTGGKEATWKIGDTLRIATLEVCSNP